ncbi:MAG: hypothetical protein KF768_09430 [Phycisphaeraceae bacterium]|nr:hypothetical protein [Phycisphaeraceae bacterium]
MERIQPLSGGGAGRTARFAPEGRGRADAPREPELPAHRELEVEPPPPTPEEVRKVSPEGRPAESDHLSGHSLWRVMIIPALLCGTVGLIVSAYAGLAAGFVALLIVCALASAFNPVFWAAGNRAREREQIVERHRHDHHPPTPPAPPATDPDRLGSRA